MQNEIEPPRLITRTDSEKGKRRVAPRHQPEDVADDAVKQHMYHAVYRNQQGDSSSRAAGFAPVVQRANER